MRCRTRRAMTLVEVLAVCALLGILLGSTIGSWASLSGPAARDAAVSTLRASIETAISSAQRIGRSDLRLDGGRLSVGSFDGDNRDRGRRFRLPVGWSAVASTDHRSRDDAAVVRFDAWGRTTDAVMVVSGPRGESLAVRLLGATGQLVIEGAHR